MTEARRSLEQLYAETSKHGQYQTLPDRLAEVLGVQFDVNEDWRGDRPRYPVIKEYVEANSCESLIDIGANTGFFALSLAADLPGLKVTACELNKTHAKIIELLAEVGNYDIPVTDRAADLENANKFGTFDCALHLNILHHAGQDFDAVHVPRLNDFESYAIEYLRSFRYTAKRMVFQMGYNWKGDKQHPIVARNDQAGKVRLTQRLMKSSGWVIERVAFAIKGKTSIVYESFDPNELPVSDIELQEWLNSKYGEGVWSEFYQRPIWFCRVSGN